MHSSLPTNVTALTQFSFCTTRRARFPIFRESRIIAQVIRCATGSAVLPVHPVAQPGNQPGALVEGDG